MQRLTILATACMLAGCASSNAVETSGKIGVPIAEVPAAVLAAATAARPSFRFAEAERETRDGRRYFDVGGTLADGSDVEFDIMEEGGRWRVVEIQRDLQLSGLPSAVREAARRHDAAFTPGRIIESDQTDGIVIYELFGAKGSDPQGRKVEIKWDGSRAEVLTKEWAH
ncbi:MAG TPA: hypothetical protein VGC35_14315 [Allosphingosinicella sp.]|jgi:hypothetical protein